MLAVTCSNKDKGKDVIAVCNVGCIGCGACARASSLFTLKDNLSTIDFDAYSPTCSLEVLDACKKCKRQRLVFVGKPTKAAHGSLLFTWEMLLILHFWIIARL